MGIKGFVLSMVWGELKKRILPNLQDFFTALIFTIIFGFLCDFTKEGYVLFFLLSLVLVYVVSRLTRAVNVILQLGRVRDKIFGK